MPNHLRTYLLENNLTLLLGLSDLFDSLGSQQRRLDILD